MSKNTGIDQNALSLPKGGGAVQGLSATFETDLNTGTGSYTVPVNVPAGPNGIQPRIAIRYHSAAGNGPFGIGWTLGTMTIARRTEDRIPVYDADDDAFVLSGVDDLVPIGSGRYRPRVDTSHLRMQRQSSGWQVTDTQGTVHLLGMTPGSRVEVMEGGRAKTAMWLLEEMHDANGNSVRYEYRREGPQRYLQRVQWGTYVLELSYEPRPDRLSTGRFGFLLSTDLRCSRIELHVTTLTPSLARSWRLGYDQAEGSGLSLLSRVTLAGHAADGSSAAVPVLRLGYTKAGERTLDRFAEALPGTTPMEFTDGRLDLLDWDGDGLPDLFELTRGRARVWPNLGRGRWGLPRTLPDMPAPASMEDPGLAFGDMDGNATADLILLDRPLISYYPHRPGGGFDRPVRFRQGPSSLLSDGNARLVDLNADGVADLLVTSPSGFLLYFRTGDTGWSAAPRVVPRSQAPPVNLGDLRIRIADMNGDGLPDLVRVTGAGVTYWPSLGNGRWGEAVVMRGAPGLPRDVDLRRLYVVNVDGDGCADLLYVDYGQVMYWLNEGGGSFGERQEIGFTPPGRPDQVRVADMKGSGTVGVLWSRVASGARSAGYAYLDLCGGSKPYLLSSIDNGLGLQTEITYRPSTEFALDDRDSGRPWPTFHPFPVQCVAEVRLRDLVTGMTSVTRHRYHDGRFDDRLGAFLGFGTVDTESVGDPSIPTLRTRNIYHLGLDPADPARRLQGDEAVRLGALRRRLLRTETYGLDGSAAEERPFQVVRHEYRARLEPGLGGAQVAVPFETRTVEEQWERGGAPFAFREITYAEPDDHGNITGQRLRAWREGQPDPDQDVTTEILFSANETTHVLSTPARVTQRDQAGVVLSDVLSFYDGPAHQGLTLGQVAEGNLTRRLRLAIADDLAAAVYGTAQPDWPALGYIRVPREDGWWIREVSYERLTGEAGTTLVARGPRGFDTRLDHDSSDQYPSRLLDAAGNETNGTADQRAFQMATLTDPNGNTVTERFDPLGRVAATVNPGDTPALPSTLYEYRTDTIPIRLATRSRQRSGQADTLDEFQYFTGRGEILQQVVEGEGDPGRSFIVQESREYTSRGQLAVRYLPFYVASSEFAEPPLSQPKLQIRYDPLGRPVEQRKADGLSVTQAYGPGTIEQRDEAENAGGPAAPTVQRLDALRRVLRVERRLPDRTIAADYRYDSLNQLVAVIHPDGGRTQLTHDLLGRVLVEETPDTGRTVFVLNAAGNQVRRTLATGKALINTFDVLGRLAEVRQAGSDTPDITYSFLDQGTAAPPDGVRNRRSQLWRISDGVGTVTLAYDHVGRVVQNRRSVDALGGHELVTDVEYDALGREVQTTLPEPAPGAGRRIVTTRYSARGLPEASPGFVRSVTYDAEGRATRVVYQNGAENLVNFDPLSGRPSRLRVQGPGGVILRDQTFTYDQVGNTTRVDAPLPAEAGTFTYDRLSRLTDARYDSGEHFTYTYADGGNITQIGGLGDLSYQRGPGSGAVTQVGADSYTYDADGHLQTAPYGSLRFDALDNLARVDLADGQQVDFTFDFQGRRALKRVTPAGGGPPVLTIQADPHIDFYDGRPLIWITFGNRRILALARSGGFYLHTDLLGTPTLFTDLTGAEVRRVGFGPYGTVRFDSAAGAGPGAALGIGGQPLDIETGLLCLGRRFYDPRLGRFISPDRAVPGIYLLDAWNRYLFGHDNPLRYVDPSGRFSWGDFFAILGIAVLVAALVVAGFFTGGATWAIAGAVINVSGLLFATAVGVAAGAILGGIAAAQAGGDIWKGVLFGGFVGGVAAFGGGVLGAMAGSAAGSLFSSQYAISMVGGAVQGAIVGAGTGAAIGFAGGKGTAESIWTHMWKGAAIGAISGAILGLLSAYIHNTPNATLRLLTLDKINPETPAEGGLADQLKFLDSSATVGQSIGRAATGTGVGGFGTFVSVGSGSGSSLISVSLAAVPDLIMNSGGLVFATNVLIGLNQYGGPGLNFGEVLIFLLEVAPYFTGVFFTFSSDAKWDWFEDMRRGLDDAFSMQ